MVGLRANARSGQGAAGCSARFATLSGSTTGSDLRGVLGTFAVTYATTGVPEPGTWLLAIAGFAACGAMLRRARTWPA